MDVVAGSGGLAVVAFLCAFAGEARARVTAGRAHLVGTTPQESLDCTA